MVFVNNYYYSIIIFLYIFIIPIATSATGSLFFNKKFNPYWTLRSVSDIIYTDMIVERKILLWDMLLII